MTMPTFDWQTIKISEASEANFYFTVSLDGEDFKFDFKYNSRDSHWYFDLIDSEGNAVRQGVKCVINWPLLYSAMDENTPAGEILFVDSREVSFDPDYLALGVTALLTYGATL